MSRNASEYHHSLPFFSFSSSLFTCQFAERVSLSPLLILPRLGLWGNPSPLSYSLPGFFFFRETVPFSSDIFQIISDRSFGSFFGLPSFIFEGIFTFLNLFWGYVASFDFFIHKLLVVWNLSCRSVSSLLEKIDFWCWF